MSVRFSDKDKALAFANLANIYKANRGKTPDWKVVHLSGKYYQATRKPVKQK